MLSSLGSEVGMMSLLPWIVFACRAPCGPGTVEEEGVCVPVEEGDADTDADTDTDSDTDTDADTDGDPCAPPDTFWGLVPAAVATTAPHATSYDAGLAEVWPEMVAYGSGIPAQTWNIVDATITLVDVASGTGPPARWYVQDGRWSVGGAPWNLPSGAAPGDRIRFTTRSFVTYDGNALFEQLTDPVITSSGNPVYVREVGSEPLDYWGRGAELVRVHGEIVETLDDDCFTGFTCHVLEHGGTRDVVWVKDDNDQDLEPGVTGVCFEAVASVGTYDPDPGDGDPGPARLEATSNGLFRTWAKAGE